MSGSFLLIVLCIDVIQLTASNRIKRQQAIIIGNCKIELESKCPHADVNFFFYNRETRNVGKQVSVETNLSEVSFDPLLPTKILIHGYNSDMFLAVLGEIKNQYFLWKDMNVFLIDWNPLGQGPCYPAAVWNTRLVGKCTAQLIKKIHAAGSTDIHLIGFSLGAHVAGYASNYLKPHTISRITGLDPAMPGFATVPPESKLDSSDADFVDVIHTNAFVQGTPKQSGHVDFYMNGGIVQPGCWAQFRALACSHHRSAIYFAESINTDVGFWGWSCPSYFDYLAGRCLPTERQILMGEFVNTLARGFHFVLTNSVFPFAIGKYTGPVIEIFRMDETLWNK